MISKPWYDPLAEKWHYPKEKPAQAIEPEPVKDEYQEGIERARINRIWEAVEDVSKI